MPPKAPRKSQKKSQKSQPSVSDRITDAAFSLAETQGWSLTSVRDIADEAGVSLDEFYEAYNCKEDILIAYGDKLDRQVIEAFSDFNPETPVRDLIFDILMERFDLANEHKRGIRSVLESLKADPAQMVLSFSALGVSMTKMLELAGVSPYGIKGAIRVTGLTSAAIWVTRTWLGDETPDLSKTMAALDKALSTTENFADRFNL